MTQREDRNHIWEASCFPFDLGAPQVSLAPCDRDVLYCQKSPACPPRALTAGCALAYATRFWGQGGTQLTGTPALLELLTASWHGCSKRLSIPEGLSLPLPQGGEAECRAVEGLVQGHPVSEPGALHHFLLLTVGLPSGLIQLSTLEQRVAVTKGFFRHNPTKRRQSCYVSRRQELRL